MYVTPETEGRFGHRPKYWEDIPEFFGLEKRVENKARPSRVRGGGGHSTGDPARQRRERERERVVYKARCAPCDLGLHVGRADEYKH